MITKKILTRLTGYLLSAAQLITPAYATSISSVPVDTSNTVSPNIIFALDDSGSMDFEVLQDTNDGAMWYDLSAKSFTGPTGVPNFNSAGGASGSWYKYAYLFPNGSGSDARVNTDATNDHFAIAPTPAYSYLRSSDYNPLYYNPSTTYFPWAPAYLGSPAKSQTFSAASPTTPRSHPWLPISGTAVTEPITTSLASNAANWTFRMLEGMTIPGKTVTGITGAMNQGAYKAVTTDYVIKSGETWDVVVPFVPATYWVKDATCTTGWPACATAPDNLTLRRYEIKSGATFPSGRSYADELQNFANWFTYYRKRKLMLAASMGQVLSQLTSIRGGVVNLNNRATVTMSDFSSTDPAKNWQSVLATIYTNPANGGTPTRDALDYIGKQYMRKDAHAPIQYACQHNAAMVLTDGFANATSSVTLPTYSKATHGANGPYQPIYANTLADIGLYYYTTKLRPDVAAAGLVGHDPSDASPNADKNTNLHMNTYALVLGSKGTIYKVDAAKTTAPFTNVPTWPNPNQDRNPTAVDDLWHATINGRGLMLSAADSAGATSSIQTALTDVLIKAGSQSAVAVSRVNLKAGDSSAYVSSYQVNGWYGDLQAFPIDPATGIINSTSPSWSAQTLLDQTSSDARLIAVGQTGSAGPAVPFRAANVSSATSALLNLSTSDNADVLSWLRGDRSKETTTYRSRIHVLGDIVYSEPEVVKGPAAAYLDPGYAKFASGLASRNRVIYQGANDGMLHAFNAATGAELWSYIPSFVVPQLKNLASKSFTHQFYVDGSPVSGDVDFGSSDWHTILVSGLRAGGKGFFALDVTSPTAADEAAVAGKVLWEFPNASTPSASANNVGLSFGKPIIAKIAGQGWVVLVSSGYNNTAGDGKGHLFVLNAKTGALIADVATTVGSAGDPSGLAQLSAFAANGRVDATIDTVYGGDLKGNLWRFNLKGAISTWSAVSLAALTDGTNAQPISTAPELSTVNTTAGVKRMVFVGTGQLLASADTSTTQTQSFYGIVDDGTATPTISNVRNSLFQKTITISGTTRNISGAAVDYSSYKGWYFDLPAGERVNADPQAAFGLLVFSSNQPSSTACSSSSYLYTVGQTTGGAVTGQPAGVLLGQSLASRPVILVTSTGLVRVITHLGDNGVVTTPLPVNVSPPPRPMAWKTITR